MFHQAAAVVASVSRPSDQPGRINRLESRSLLRTGVILLPSKLGDSSLLVVAEEQASACGAIRPVDCPGRNESLCCIYPPSSRPAATLPKILRGGLGMGGCGGLAAPDRAMVATR